MKKNVLEYKALKRALAFLLAFSLTLGSLPLTSVDVEAQEAFNVFKTDTVQPAKAMPLYDSGGTRGQLVLDTDGFVWGNTTLSGAKDSNNATPGQTTPLNRVRGIDKPIRDIDAGRYGFNLAVSTDNKTLYIFGSSGYKTLGTAATKINDNVYKYDFFEKQGVKIVDIAASSQFGYVVDSNGDIWSFGLNWDSVRGGSGETPNKFAGKNFTLNHAKNTDGKLTGTFNMIDAPEGTDSQWPTFVATTTTGEIFVWGYDYGPGRGFVNTTSTTGTGDAVTANTGAATNAFSSIFGTTDKNGKAYTRGVPIEIDNSAIIAAEGGSLTPEKPYVDIAGGRGAFIVTQKGKVFFHGATGHIDYGMASGLGNTFGTYAVGNGKFAYTPQQITKAFDTNQASNETPSLDITNTKFIDIESSYGGSTLLDNTGNVYQVGENWQTSTDTATPDNYTWFKKYTPKTTLLLSGGTPLNSGTRQVVGIGTSRQATDYIVYDSSNSTYSAYAAGYEQGGIGAGGYSATYVGNPETAKIDFIQEGVMFTGAKGTGNVTKPIAPAGGSKVDPNNNFYSETGSDLTGVTPSLKFELTVSQEVQKGTFPSGVVAKKALSMHDTSAGGNNSSMRYVVVQSSNVSKYGNETYYDLAIDSRQRSTLPEYLQSRGTDVPSEISVDMFEQMYADASIIEKGKMNKTTGTLATAETKWESEGSVSGNSMVIVCAKTTRNGMDFYTTMAFPIDNYYKQTKSYYKGVATTNAYAGTINIFGAKAIPGQYGVYVDEYNNPILDKNNAYNPPNGVDTTPDLSKYLGPNPTTGTAGYYLSNVAVSPKLKYWKVKPASADDTLTLNPTDSATPYSVLQGKTVDVANTLTYNYEKDPNQWSSAKVHYGYYLQGNTSTTKTLGTLNDWVEISNDVMNNSTLGHGKAMVDDTVTSVLPGGANATFWPKGGNSYSDGGDVFTPAQLNTEGVNAKLTLVGYKIGSQPAGEFDYTPCNFGYDPLTGEFDFNPSVEEGKDIFLVYKPNTYGLYERYLNADKYVASNANLQDPKNWNYNLGAKPVQPATLGAGAASSTTAPAVNIQNALMTTSGAAIQLLQGQTADKLFYEIDRIVGGSGLNADGTINPNYDYNTYFTRQAAVVNNGTVGVYKKPITQINNHVLVGYFDELGAMHSFWDPTTLSFVTPTKIETAGNITAKTNINMIYLTDSNYNGIPDVMEGSVEEKWIAVTASGSQVLMHREFTTGYKAHQKFVSKEDNYVVGSQWIYKSTDTATNGVIDNGSASTLKSIDNLPFIDDQPNVPASTPTYDRGNYTYTGNTGYRTINYYYNEDSNENGVIDVSEPIKVTVKGVNKQGKELYSWPLEASYSESEFTIDAMQLPTYANFTNPTLVDSKGAVTIVSPSQVKVNPGVLGNSSTELDRTITVTFIYDETLSTLKVNQYDLGGDLIGTFNVPVDYTKPYNSVVPAIKGYTFNEAKTIAPFGGDAATYTETQKAGIPTYSNGKVVFNNLAKDGTADKNVMNLYYSKDSGNITIYAVDMDTLGSPIVIGSTTNRTIATNGTFNPADAASDPEVFEIPALSNYDLKAISTSSPFNPAFDLAGTKQATTQTFDGTTPLQSVYYYYTRKSGSIVAEAILEDGSTINNLAGSAVATIYDSEVGQTEIITPPVDSALRDYVLVGVIDSTGRKIMGGTSASVYVVDDSTKYTVKFIYRKLADLELHNITYVDNNNDKVYNAGDSVISDRVLNMLENEKVTLVAPEILTYKYEDTYTVGRDGKATGVSTNTSVSVDANTDKTIYFRYSQVTSKVTINAISSAGPEGGAGTIVGTTTVNVPKGLVATVYAPNIPGYYLNDVTQKITASAVVDDSQVVTFNYAPLEDIAANYMAEITVIGRNVADDSKLYEYKVKASKNKTFTANAINLPTYSVDADSKDVNVSYTDTDATIEFYYTTLLEGATAYFYDDTSGTFFAPADEIENAMKGKPISQRASLFEDYNGKAYYYVGYTTTKPDATHTVHDSSPVGKIASVDSSNNAIYFHYKQFTDENIKVYSVEDNGSGDPTKMPVISMGSATVTKTAGATTTVTAPALTAAGYTSPAVTTKTVTYVAGKDMYEVYFVYTKKLANVEIYAVDLDNGNAQIGSGPVKTIVNQRVAETLVVEPPYVGGYYTKDSATVMVVDLVNNKVTFGYHKLPQQTLTVKAVDANDATHVLNTYTIKTVVGDPVTITPVEIIGWKLQTATDKNPKTVIVDPSAMTMEYKYVKDESTVKFAVVDKHGVDLSSKLEASVKTSFNVANNNSTLGYELSHTVYAPHIKDYILTDTSIRSYTYTDATKTEVPKFEYQSIEDVAKDYMTKITVKYFYKDGASEMPIFAYDMYVPRNEPVVLKANNFENYKLLDSEPLTKTINVNESTTDTIFTFEYISTVGEIEIKHVNSADGAEIETSYFKYDAEVGQPYSYNADALNGYYYVGYTIDDADPAMIGKAPNRLPTMTTDAPGKVITTAFINEVQTNGHQIYFHYEPISDKVSIHLVEYVDTVDATGNNITEKRTILVTSGGNPERSMTYNYDDDLTLIGGTNLENILADEYYVIDENYPTSIEYDYDGMQAQRQNFEFVFKKRTQDVTLEVKDEKGEVIGTEVVENVRLGEYNTFVFPNVTNYSNINRTQGVYVTPDTTSVVSRAVKLLPTTYTINYVNKETGEIFDTVTLDVLSRQDATVYPKGHVGWKLADGKTTSSAAIEIKGATNPTTRTFEFVPNMQDYTVVYEYTNPNTGVVTQLPGGYTKQTPKTDRTLKPVYSLKETVLAANFKDYVLIGDSIDTITDSTVNYTKVFKYKKITDVLDEYTVQVNVIGKGTSTDADGVVTSSDLYKYTLMLPANSTYFKNNINVITTQSVPTGYELTGIPTVVGSDGAAYNSSAYSYDSDKKTITILETFNATATATAGDITVTYDYTFVPETDATIEIRAINTVTGQPINTTPIVALRGTKITGTRPVIAGYTTTDVATKPGTVGSDTYIDFAFTPIGTADATVNYVLENGSPIKSYTVKDVVATETTRFNLAPTFVYNGTIYNISTSQPDYIQVVGGGNYNVKYVNGGPAKQTVTVTVPGHSSTETVYVDRPVEVIKEVVKEVTRYENERQVYPIDSGKLYVDEKIGYVSGYSDGSFRPNAPATRAEVAAMFYTLTTDPNKDNKINNAFADVKNDAWYSQAVNYLASEGLLSGYGNGQFKPNETITRAEFAAISSRFDELNKGTGSNPFPDVQDGHWAENAINSAYANGWIGGYPTGNYQPNGKVTRAEAVRIVNCMTGRANKTIYTQADNIYNDVTTSHWAFQEIMEARRDH